MSDCPNIKFPIGKEFRGWVVEKNLNEGGFGQVYVVRSRKDGSRAALKAESNSIDGGSAVKLEIKVLRALNSDGEKPHVPVYYAAAKHKKYCYMVMTLLGPNLKDLKAPLKGENFTPSTWLRLGIQCLYALKILHDKGFVHRDIKPNNFVMGGADDPVRSRCVHILDFGLSRGFAFKVKGRWVARWARGSAQFRGTVRYCSPNVHDEIEQGRRDDIWALFFVLIECHCGLPWQTLRDKNKLITMKCNMKDEHVMQNMPREFANVLQELRKLDCYSRPDYYTIYRCFVACLHRKGITNDEPYDWETDKSKILKSPKPPLWTDAAAFFKSDPISIHVAPDNKDQDLVMGLDKDYEEKEVASRASAMAAVKAAEKNKNVKDNKNKGVSKEDKANSERTDRDTLTNSQSTKD